MAYEKSIDAREGGKILLPRTPQVVEIRVGLCRAGRVELFLKTVDPQLRLWVEDRRERVVQVISRRLSQPASGIAAPPETA